MHFAHEPSNRKEPEGSGTDPDIEELLKDPILENVVTVIRESREELDTLSPGETPESRIEG